MREKNSFKFRAWLKSVDEMVEVLGIDFYNKEVAYIWTEQVSDYELEQTREVDKIDDLDLMQYTGLKDKNGVEIYVGDVVRVTDDDGRTDFSDGGIGTVRELKDLGMWYIDGQLHNALFDINQCYYIEVIGNVYENTELLEDR